MARQTISTSWDRNNRNAMEHNFTELYNELSGINNEVNNIVGTISDEAFEKIVDSAKLNWQLPVNTYNDITTTYPNPEEGWTVMCRDTGKIYRYDGTAWKEIQDIDPTAYNEIEDRVSTEIGNLSTQLGRTENAINTLKTDKMDKDTTDISVSQINKNKGKFDQTYMTDEFLQQIAGNTPVNAVPADKSITTAKYVPKSVTPNVTNFAMTNNLFDNTYTKGVGLAGAGFNDIVYSESTIMENAYSVIMQLEKNKTYTVSKSDDTNRFGIALFVGKPQPSQRPNRIVTLPTELNKNPVSFTLQGDEEFVVIYVSNSQESKIPDWLQVEEGSTATEPNAVQLLNLKKHSIPSDAISLDEYVIVDSKSNYKTETPFIPRSVADSASSMYAEYDNLMNSNSDYITKQLLGNESTGLPIYLYKFRPSHPQNLGEKFKNPRILFISGTHGQEDRAMLETLRFFSDLVNNWKNSDALSMLRWSVEFDVIPVLNPYGLNNKQRKNGNGVDINRNFPDGWVLNPDPTSIYYGGPSPLSEIESQLIDNYLKANPDLIFAIDYHKYNTLESDGHATWMGTTEENIQKVLTSVARYTNSTIKTDYPFVDQTNSNLTSISMGDNPGIMHKHFTHLGIPGIILETVWNIGGSWDEQDEFYVEKNSQKFSVDLIGNLILTAVRRYKELRF